MAKRITGAILVLAGAAISIWTVISIIKSDQPFNFQTLLGLVIPVMFIKYGWQWLTARTLESRRGHKDKPSVSDK